MGLPVLQSFTGGQYVHQLLAVTSQSQFRQGVRAGARRRAFPDEPQPPAHEIGVGPQPHPDRRRLAEQRLHQHRRRFRRRPRVGVPGCDEAGGAGAGIGCDVTAPVVDVDLVAALGQRVGSGDADNAGAKDGYLHRAAPAAPPSATTADFTVRTVAVGDTALDSVSSFPLVSGASSIVTSQPESRYACADEHGQLHRVVKQVRSAVHTDGRTDSACARGESVRGGADAGREIARTGRSPPGIDPST